MNIENLIQEKEILLSEFTEKYSELKKKEDYKDDGNFRSPEDGLYVLGKLFVIREQVFRFLKEHPHFSGIFQNQWGDYEFLFHSDTLLEICLASDFIFPDSMGLPIGFSGELDKGLIEKYPITLEDWFKTTLDFHEESQKILRESFKESLFFKDLPCGCEKCFSDYKSILRDHVFKYCQDIIESQSEEILNYDYDDPSTLQDTFYHLKKRIDKKLNLARFRLKRGSFNKLKNQIDSSMERKFGPKSSVGKEYIKLLDGLLKEQLKERGLRRDLVEDSQKQRFFAQQGMGIWRSLKSLRKEFKKLINTVLALKRQDISANILKEYLGQFWLYTEARRINRKFVYHMGPTNSGKTYHAIQALSKVGKGCYLAPLRLLATELYDTLNDLEVPTSLLTGEEVIDVPNATHYSSTIEMAKLKEEFDCVVIDEIQMINDSQRGWAWTRALVGMQAPEIHICGDPSVLELIKEICDLCGDTLEIKKYERMTDLQVQTNKIKANELEKNDAVIVFSRRNALKYKSDLERLGYKVSIVYGRLSPEVRREQARKFDSGETDIIVSTDAIAMGMNLPIKRVVFTTLSKFIDSKEIQISNSEIKQIAGRAGRFKRFPTGTVTCLERVEDGLEKIQDALVEELNQKEQTMVGPDLDIYQKVNSALTTNALPVLSFTEFLRLFNTMTFREPFYCVDLKEMIEVAEMVENSNKEKKSLSSSEIFGFSCAPVNLGLSAHVQYFVYIVNNFVNALPIKNELIDFDSDNIDYLETSIKCVELYQWLARHFSNKHFDFDEKALLQNKGFAVDQLNNLLSKKIILSCSSCGVKLPFNHQFAICEKCFKKRRFNGGNQKRDRFRKSSKSGSGDGKDSRKKKSGSFSKSKKNKKTTKKRSGTNKAAAFKKGRQ